MTDGVGPCGAWVYLLVGGTAEAVPFPVDDGLLPPTLTSKSMTLGVGHFWAGGNTRSLDCARDDRVLVGVGIECRDPESKF
jgi:hypothetical protein